MSDVDRVLLGMVIGAASLFVFMASYLGILMFIYRRELDLKYVFLGIRKPEPPND